MMGRYRFCAGLKGIGINLLLAAICIVMVLLISEVLLRILWPQNLNITRLDETLLFELKPGIISLLARQDFSTHVIINSQGLRDKEYSQQKPDGVFRIAIVGDSFTFGFGVEQNETFADILETNLNAKRNNTIEVMNFGVSAYGTEQELLIIREKVISYKPDMVLLAFYPNDIKENIKYNLFSVEKGTLIEHGPRHISVSERIRNFISWHSHLYSLIYFAVIDKDWISSVLIKLHIINAPLFDPTTDYDALLYSKTQNQEYEFALSKTLLLIEKSAQTTQQHNASFTVILIPTKEQVYAYEMDKFLLQKGISHKDIDEIKIQRNIRAGLLKENIQFVDMLVPFREHGQLTDTPRLYFPIDGHWTAEGHRLAAQVLEDELTEIPE